MSFFDTKVGLDKRLADGWGTTTYIHFQNNRLVPPKDRNNNPLPYITHTVRQGSGEDIVLGSATRWYRWSGIVIIQIFVPENIGMKLATQHADSLKAIYLAEPRSFTYEESGIIRLWPPSVQEIGIVDGYYQVNVIVPWKRDSQS